MAAGLCVCARGNAVGEVFDASRRSSLRDNFHLIMLMVTVHSRSMTSLNLGSIAFPRAWVNENISQIMRNERHLAKGYFWLSRFESSGYAVTPLKTNLRRTS